MSDLTRGREPPGPRLLAALAPPAAPPPPTARPPPPRLTTGGGVIKRPPPSARAQAQLYISLTTCRWRWARNDPTARRRRLAEEAVYHRVAHRLERGGGGHLELYPIVTSQYSVTTLYTRFPIIFSSRFSKVTIRFSPTATVSGRAGCRTAAARAERERCQVGSKDGSWRFFAWRITNRIYRVVTERL
jgi:hypothetical protein